MFCYSGFGFRLTEFVLSISGLWRALAGLNVFGRDGRGTVNCCLRQCLAFSWVGQRQVWLRGCPEDPLPYHAGEWMESVAWETVLTAVGGSRKEGRELFRAMVKEKSKPNAMISLSLSFPVKKILRLEYVIEKFWSYSWKYSCRMRKIALKMKKIMF